MVGLDEECDFCEKNVSKKEYTLPDDYLRGWFVCDSKLCLLSFKTSCGREILESNLKIPISFPQEKQVTFFRERTKQNETWTLMKDTFFVHYMNENTYRVNLWIEREENGKTVTLSRYTKV